MSAEGATSAKGNRAQRRYTMADGVGIIADIAGDPHAPTVVLMHGGGQTRHSWSSAMRTMAQAGYRVINYDARGHGDSSWSPDGKYAFDIYSRDLMEIARDIEGKFALIGASLGGATAIHAINRGLNPDALILVDIIPHANLAGVRRIRDFMSGYPEGFASLEEAASAVAAYNPLRPMPQDHEGLRKNLRQRADGRYRWHWDPRILDNDYRTQMALLERAVVEYAENQATPTLLVRGTQSDVVTDSGVAEFRKLLPALEVTEVAKAGHMVAGDQNDTFNASVLQYLLRRMPPGAVNFRSG
jgi:pimeloyl-ACP methyl ester carboxylesterase